MSAKARILVVDDERGMCEFLRFLLQEEGYQVDVAHSGVQALDKVREDKFHLILADIKMPGLDGLEMLRQLREADEETDPPPGR